MKHCAGELDIATVDEFCGGVKLMNFILKVKKKVLTTLLLLMMNFKKPSKN